MPNHCINELIFREVDAEAQARILAVTVNAEASVDFEILVPPPLNMWWGNVGSDHERAFKRTFLDWARDNWGTKWNAYSCDPPEVAGETLTLRFKTAWAPPYPWLAAILNSLNLPFEHNSLSEGGEAARHGEFSVPGTAMESVRWREADADESMQRHLHKLLWGVKAFEEEEA